MYDLAQFNVFDTRQYRDDQANGDGAKTPNDVKRTLTGTEQEHWLLGGLDQSTARGNVIPQQVSLPSVILRAETMSL